MFFVYLLAGFGLMSQMFRLDNGQKELKGKLGRYWEIKIPRGRPSSLSFVFKPGYVMS